MNLGRLGVWYPVDRLDAPGIARLARLRVAEEEKEALAGELSNILTFIEQLGEVDTKDVAPMTSVIAQPLRRRFDLLRAAAQHGDLGPGGAKGMGDGQVDPARRTCDEDVLAGELAHIPLPWLFVTRSPAPGAARRCRSLR